ncbi:MAG: DUF2079 domain-containing protein [Acidimicrobiales bacterium]|nr:DUF2079 domain-containing protein [Acidimicrobiales bacterium]
MLRVQGRLDSDNADRWLPWLFALLIALAFGLMYGARVRSLDGGSGLAPWLQAAWRRGHGGAGVPMTGTDPARGTWSIVSEAVLQVTRVVPAESVFVVVQAIALGLAVVPLWRLARREARLRVGASTVIVIAFALAPVMNRAAMGAFHPELLAVPALIAAYDRSCRGQWVRFGLLLVFAVLCRADLGITVAALDALLVVEGKRFPGGAAILCGLAWSATANVAIGRDVPHEALTPAGEFLARSALPLAVAPDVFRHPWDTLLDLAAEPSVIFLMVVLAPLLFLPLVAPRRAVLAAPCLVLAMVADRAVQRTAGQGVLDLSPAAAHIGPAMAFVFVALVYALARIGHQSVTRVNVDHRVLFALLAGVLLLFATESPVSPYEHPWSWGGRDALDGARMQSADLVGHDAAVATSPQVSALLAARAVIVEMPPHPRSFDKKRIERIADEVQAIVLDTSETVDDEGQPVWTSTRRALVVDEFEQHGFTVVSDIQNVLVLVRDDGA